MPLIDDPNAKVVVITGASSGIGEATAIELSKRGAVVVIAARSENKLKEIQDYIKNNQSKDLSYHNPEHWCLVVKADVRKMEDMNKLFREALNHYGKVDVWINNAGVYAAGEVDKIPAEDFKLVHETNYDGVVNGTKAVLSYFKNEKHGRIINMGTSMGEVSVANTSAYLSSKAAVHTFTESLRQEVKDDNIKVCLVIPQSVDTLFYKHAVNYTGHELKPPIPVLKVEDVAYKIANMALKDNPKETLYLGDTGIATKLSHMFVPGMTSKVFSNVANLTQQKEIHSTEGILEKSTEKLTFEEASAEQYKSRQNVI